MFVGILFLLIGIAILLFLSEIIELERRIKVLENEVESVSKNCDAAFNSYIELLHQVENCSNKDV